MRVSNGFYNEKYQHTATDNRKELRLQALIAAVLIGSAPAYAYTTLQEAVSDTEPTREYIITSPSETINGNLGSMGGDGSTLTIDGGTSNFGIDGNGYKGINVNEGQTLNINNVGSSDVQYGINETEHYYDFVTDENGNITFQEVSAPTETSYNFVFKDAQQYGMDAENNPLYYSVDSKAAIENFTNQGWRTGGAITNSGNLSIDNTVFYNNKTTTWDTAFAAEGAAVRNETAGIISNLNGTFIENQGTYGGAVYNLGKIDSISGNFINNYASGDGGGIWSSGDIDKIDGVFIANSAGSNGGAIRTNSGTIKEIDGIFIDNTSINYGGAIFNNGVMENVSGTYINNFGRAGGGAVFNRDTMNNLDGYFYNNSTEANGGAFQAWNTSNTGNVSGTFIKNLANGSGGAIYNNNSPITNISGDFLLNTAGGTSSSHYGGAIANSGYNANIESIKGNFLLNTAESENNNAFGGAIYNFSGLIENIDGTFIENSVSSQYTGRGGAIYNEGTINNISGNFYSNKASGTGERGAGAAIYNTKDITSITGVFKNNEAYSPDSLAYGGAIYNSRYINTISGDFIGNKAYSDSDSQNSTVKGGAIMSYWNYATIDNITGNFNENSAKGYNAYGGAISNSNTAIIKNITGNFVNNNVTGTNIAYGGAIANESQIVGDYTDDVVNIAIDKITLTNEITGESITFYQYYGDGTLDEIIDAVKNEGYKIISSESEYSQEVTEVEWDTIIQEFPNAVEEGLIYEDNPLNNFAGDDFAKPTGGIVNSSFIGNSAVSSNGAAKGGAIYSTTDLNIEADNAQSVFAGNYVEYTDENGELIHDDNAIYLDNSNATLSFNLKNKGSIVMKDNIDGVTGYNVDITGDDKDNTVFYLHNDIKNADVSFDNTTINTINDDVHVYDFNSFTVSGDTNFVADVDLKNHEMDRITADSYGEHSGNINVIGMNLLSDANEDEEITEVFFAETGLMDNVTNGTGELPDAYQTAYTPIYKYKVDYETREDDGGYFLFQKAGANSSNPSDNFNEAVLSTPVANLAAGQAAINEAFKYVFEHADAFTQLPSMERYAKINANKYALSTDFNNNMPDYSTYPDKGVWFRPYTTFESMNLKNGPDVDAITYGSLVGFDGDFKEMKNGWHRVFTGYTGYTGSSLNYSGIDTTMNGGLLGFTETFYKGNFWTAITASAGASVGESHSMYGKEDYTSLLAGVGSKTGYNFEFKDGKFIIQPIMFLSYTFVNTFDYKNAAGVNIESDPLHTIQLNPSVRFIANLKNGWQPYASVGMVWNLMNESKVTANNVKLPEMSVKPYVEYGVGIQRNWAEKYTGFLQAMIRNGGRNGIALTGGFRFKLGNESKKNPDAPKKEIKAL